MNRFTFEDESQDLVVVEDIPDFDSFQCAQDPLEDFSERYPELSTKNQQKEKKGKKKREAKKMSRIHHKSYVISKDQRKGHRLIQIKVLDLASDQDSEDAEGENVVLSAHYVVKDTMDEILDETRNIIHKISKKLCGVDSIY